MRARCPHFPFRRCAGSCILVPTRWRSAPALEEPCDRSPCACALRGTVSHAHSPGQERGAEGARNHRVHLPLLGGCWLHLAGPQLAGSGEGGCAGTRSSVATPPPLAPLVPQWSGCLKATLPSNAVPFPFLPVLHHARGRTLVRLLENALLQPPGHVRRSPGGALVLPA